MKCDEPDCYEAAVISIRKDLFGKSDAMRNLCSKHGPSWSMVSGKIPDAQGPSPLDVAQARIAALESDRDHLQRGFNAAISTVEAHQATIADLEARCAALLADVNQDEGYERLKTRVAELEATLYQAPIARVIVHGDLPAEVLMYAPGLPVGEHDLYCEPTVAETK